MASKYAVKLQTDFDNPKWINRHKFMFDYLDINGNGQITLDEIVSKASDDICKNLGATPAQTKRHQDCVEAFFRGCLLYTSPSPRDKRQSRMPSSA